ncbi:MAG: hypothetical protein HOV87_01385 [Catenulispora sp.]|nr:hypothetical protein [Catenulispora sp.]
MTYRSIDAYVEDLAWRLRVGMRGRRRIMREVAAHLADLVAEEEAGGLTPQAAARRATTRFGAPEELAAEFNRDSAQHSARVAAWSLAVCFAGAFLAAGLAQTEAPANPWPGDTVYYAVTAILVQVAGFCAGTAFLLAVAAPWVLGRQQGLGTAVRAAAAAALVLVPVAVVAAGNIGAAGRLEGALSAFVAVAVPVAVVFSARALTRVGEHTPSPSTLDVIAECTEALALRWSWSARLFALITTAWTAVGDRLPGLRTWLELRRHPWRAAATVCAAAGVALKLPDLLIGDLDLPAAAFEAVAAFTGFALFGGLLGLRSGARGPERREPLDALGVEG